jgi:hypothetical protein
LSSVDKSRKNVKKTHKALSNRFAYNSTKYSGQKAQFYGQHGSVIPNMKPSVNCQKLATSQVGVDGAPEQALPTPPIPYAVTHCWQLRLSPLGPHAATHYWQSPLFASRRAVCDLRPGSFPVVLLGYSRRCSEEFARLVHDRLGHVFRVFVHKPWRFRRGSGYVLLVLVRGSGCVLPVFVRGPGRVLPVFVHRP